MRDREFAIRVPSRDADALGHTQRAADAGPGALGDGVIEQTGSRGSRMSGVLSALSRKCCSLS